jgi:hypothetical protein
MAGTSGLSSGTNGIAQLLIAAANGAAFTTLTAPLRVAFLTAVRTANNGTDTEWSTGGGYTATGSGSTGGATGLAFAAATADSTGAHQASNAAVSVSNAPAGTWAGNIVKDSTATNKEAWYAPLTGGSKTINAGDTCTIASGSFTTNLG